MNIGIDIDDTISKTFEYAYPLSIEFTRNFCKREPKSIDDIFFSNHYYLRNINEWNRKEEDFFWNENYIKIISNVAIKDNAKEVINKLKSEGNKIFLITARMKSTNFDVGQVTKNWLVKNELDYDELIIDACDKAKIAKNKKIDLFIDDSFENCLAIKNEGIKTYLIDSPVNKCDKNKNIERVYSWNEIYEKINA